MLSRTADHLFWMARYMERAENTARMLDVNYQTSLLPQSADAAENGWKGLLSISELSGDFQKHYGAVNARDVMHYMVADEENPSSIVRCLLAARENARAVRGTLTTEVWETTNQTWLEFRRFLADSNFARDPSQTFEWVKFRSHLSRGVTVGTMLQDVAFHFIRLGTFLERADNTARILDVKYDELAPEESNANEYYEWGALLRSVSAFEIYRKVYRDVITPNRVAELLILREDMPRSLHACLREVHQILGLVANSRSSETQRLAGLAYSRLRYARIDDILEVGLHGYLTEFLDGIATLGNGIAQDFLVPMA